MPDSERTTDQTGTGDRPARKNAFGDPDASLLEQMGGVRGLVYSSIPILTFVPVNAVWGLTVAIWSALGVATAMLMWSLARRENPQPAISGFIGVAICVFIAWRTGSAKGYFLYGIITQAVYAGVFAISALVRWPLVGVIWGFLEGRGMAWRRNPDARRWYVVATSMWAALFTIRAILQFFLYHNDEVNWLGVARIGMGWPLALVAFAGTVWAVRRAMKYEAAQEEPETADEPASELTSESRPEPESAVDSEPEGGPESAVEPGSAPESESGRGEQPRESVD